MSKDVRWYEVAMSLERERNPNWRGGNSLTSHGYRLIRVGRDHHLADVRGYAYEHRIIAESKIGRKLEKGEQVHHIDGNKLNNCPSNLEVCTTQEHRAKHRTRDLGRRLPGQKNPLVSCACGCGNVFEKFDPGGRPRLYISGHNPQASEAQDEILNLLKQGDLSRKILAEKAGKTPHEISLTLTRLKRKGVVSQVKHGVWGIKDG